MKSPVNRLFFSLVFLSSMVSMQANNPKDDLAGRLIISGSRTQEEANMGGSLAAGVLGGASVGGMACVAHNLAKDSGSGTALAAGVVAGAVGTIVVREARTRYVDRFFGEQYVGLADFSGVIAGMLVMAVYGLAQKK